MRGDDDDDMAELELGERLMRKENAEYLASFLEPQRLPKPDDVDEEKAHALVMSLLVQFALRNVAVHLCTHCTWRDAYRYILEDLIYEEEVPEEITGSGWTMNFNYGESCPECNAEIEEEFKDFNPDLSGADDDGEEKPY